MLQTWPMPRDKPRSNWNTWRTPTPSSSRNCTRCVCIHTTHTRTNRRTLVNRGIINWLIYIQNALSTKFSFTGGSNTTNLRKFLAPQHFHIIFTEWVVWHFTCWLRYVLLCVCQIMNNSLRLYADNLMCMYLCCWSNSEATQLLGSEVGRHPSVSYHTARARDFGNGDIVWTWEPFGGK